jgi:hypothetical protein
MDIDTVSKDFKNRVCEEIELVSEGHNRYRIFSPFAFDDGDQFSIVLKHVGSGWILTDEGHTFMHLSYDLDVRDFDKGTRQKILSNILSAFDVSDDNGELQMRVEEKDAGNALFTYIQALVKITDLTFLSRETVKSTFMEDFRAFISSIVPTERLTFDYIDKEHDQPGNYPVDCRINGLSRPIYLYGIQNESKCRDVTINLLQFEKWGIPFRPIAIFEDQEEINRKVLARFSDVAEKQFSSLHSNKDRIKGFLKNLVCCP